jgi:hypothetical protein
MNEVRNRRWLLRQVKQDKPVKPWKKLEDSFEFYKNGSVKRIPEDKAPCYECKCLGIIPGGGVCPVCKGKKFISKKKFKNQIWDTAMFEYKDAMFKYNKKLEVVQEICNKITDEELQFLYDNGII